MPLDPSISLSAGQGIAPQNPLDTFSKFATVRNLLDTNDLIKANTASTQQSTAVSQQDQGQKGGNYLAQKLGSLLTLPEEMLTRPVARQLVDHSLQEGSITPQVAKVWHERIDATNSPTDIKRLAAMGIIGTMAGPQVMQEVFGSPGTMTNGQQAQPGMIAGRLNPGAPAGAFTPAGGAVPQLLSPGEKAARHSVTAPDGTPGSVPNSSLVDNQGNPLPAVPGSGRYPSPAATAPVQTSQAPQAGVPPGFAAAGLPPGANENITAYNAAQGDVPPAVNRVAGLQKAHSALMQINSGPGTGTWQQIKSTIQSLPVVNGLVKPELGDEDTIANYDSARKYMQDYANRATIGSTAQGLQAASHANASTDISQGAALDVLRTNIGLERMGIAQSKSTGQQTHLKDASDFATAHDRRAFAADMYTPDQLKKLVGGMNETERSKFFKSLGVAQRLKLITLPGQ